MKTHTDNYIERWATVYHDNNLSVRNIRFDTFLLAPEEILIAARRPMPLAAETEGYRPLLPAQIEAVKRINRQNFSVVSDTEAQAGDELVNDEMEWHGDAGFVQPMHHRFPSRLWKTGRHTKCSH